MMLNLNFTIVNRCRHDWSVTNLHFGLLGVPLTVESVDNEDVRYQIRQVTAVEWAIDLYDNHLVHSGELYDQ